MNTPNGSTKHERRTQPRGTIPRRAIQSVRMKIQNTHATAWHREHTYTRHRNTATHGTAPTQHGTARDGTAQHGTARHGTAQSQHHTKQHATQNTRQAHERMPPEQQTMCKQRTRVKPNVLACERPREHSCVSLHARTPSSPTTMNISNTKQHPRRCTCDDLHNKGSTTTPPSTTTTGTPKHEKTTRRDQLID